MITVLTSREIAQFISSRVTVYRESHGQVSFNLSDKAFEKLYNKVRKIGLNPFAVMVWEKI